MLVLRKIFYTLGFAGLMVFLSATANGKPSFALKEGRFKNLLSAFMDEAVLLHHAVYLKNTDHIRLHAFRIRQHIQKLKNLPFTDSLSYHELSYRSRLLTRIESGLAGMLSSSEKEQLAIMHDINKTFSYLVRAYGLKRYFVFFCSKDRSTWVQKNIRPVLHLNHSVCGQVVGT